MNFDASLQHIRTVLLALPPSGEGGFEDLLATAVAAATGLQIRLARSGSQFGRDGSSPAGLFAVAVEAKRYDGNLRLEGLAGKATLASYALGKDTDLWLLGTTAELGDDVVRKLPEIVQSEGISVVFLDWAPRPLPALAVLLASRAEATRDWFAHHAPSTGDKTW